MTFNEYVGQAESFAAHPSTQAQRRGQSLFNYLYRVRPDVANMVRATEADPFYRDERIPAFYEAVEKNW